MHKVNYKTTTHEIKSSSKTLWQNKAEIAVMLSETTRDNIDRRVNITIKGTMIFARSITIFAVFRWREYLETLAAELC